MEDTLALFLTVKGPKEVALCGLVGFEEQDFVFTIYTVVTLNYLQKA